MDGGEGCWPVVSVGPGASNSHSLLLGGKMKLSVFKAGRYVICAFWGGLRKLLLLTSSKFLKGSNVTPIACKKLVGLTCR